MNKPEYLTETSTATIGLDADGLIVVRFFSGLEVEIDAKKTGLIQVGQPKSALGFIGETLNRCMFDTLILANLYPRRRATPIEKAATKQA